MKRSFLSVLTAATTATALFAIVAPAAAFTISGGTFSVETDMEVKFHFLAGHGGWLGNFGIRDENNNVLATLFTEKAAWTGNEDNDWRSTADDLTGPSVVSFNAVAGKVYKMSIWGQRSNYLKQPGVNSPFYQQDFVDAQTSYGSYTYRSTGPNSSLGYQETTTFFNGLIVGFEDGWEASQGKQGDYNDLIVGVEVPEPMTMAGLALGAGGLMAARRRRKNA